jgi:hypothetical protein
MRWLRWRGDAEKSEDGGWHAWRHVRGVCVCVWARRVWMCRACIEMGRGMDASGAMQGNVTRFQTKVLFDEPSLGNPTRCCYPRDGHVLRVRMRYSAPRSAVRTARPRFCKH